ncbi:hypothetical protein KIPB_013138, partial [Kipferlia bialata]|eukprot:g13138.t1
MFNRADTLTPWSNKPSDSRRHDDKLLTSGVPSALADLLEDYSDDLVSKLPSLSLAGCGLRK